MDPDRRVFLEQLLDACTRAAARIDAYDPAHAQLGRDILDLRARIQAELDDGAADAGG